MIQSGDIDDKRKDSEFIQKKRTLNLNKEIIITKIIVIFNIQNINVLSILIETMKYRQIARVRNHKIGKLLPYKWRSGKRLHGEE